MNKPYLCYYELHVDDRTFIVHTIVTANSVNAAISKLESEHGKNYHLQAKGCLGELTPSLAMEYMANEEVVR